MVFEQTTNGQSLVNPCQFQEEVAQGTPPTGGTYTVMPPVESISVKYGGELVDITQLGPEDILGILKGLESFDTTWKFKCTDATYAFIKRCINAANPGTPTGTVSASMTILFSFYLNDTLNYVIFKGSRIKDISGALSLGKEHIFTVSMVHTDITTPATSHGLSGSPTLSTTFPSDTVWTWDAVADPVAWGGTAQKCTEFNFTINRNAKANHILGNTKPYNAKTHGRRIGGDFTNLYTNTSIETDAKAGTARTLTVVLFTSQTLTFTSAKLAYNREDLGSDSDEDVLEKPTFKAKSVNLP